MDSYDTSSESSGGFDPIYYLGLMLRYRWLLIIPFCLAMLVGIYLALTLPREYQSETVILVESQKVPTSYVQPLASENLDERIATLSQQIKSRTNLEKIIRDFHLFTAPKYAKMYLDDKIEALRRRIDVKLSRSHREIDAFSISFRWHDPQKTMQITSTLATYFINQNLKDRESYALSTKDFLNNELRDMRSKLERTEEKLKDYRKRYMGELPEQLDGNLRMLDRLQDNLSARQQTLRESRNRLALIESQIQALRHHPVAPPLPAVGGAVPAAPVQPTTLEGLKHLLARLKARYTDQHPDVVRLEKRIATMEKEQAAGGEAGQPPPTASRPAPPGAAVPALSGPLAELVLQKTGLKGEIAETEKDIRDIQRRIDFFQKRVENTPRREQELISLKRDYDNMQASYNSMLARKLEADIAVNMEKKQKGERFRILDPAALPNKPVSPDMRKLFILAVGIGLGLGAGIVFLLDFANSGVKKPEALEAAMGIPVLATLPTVLHKKDRVLRALNLAFSLLGVLVSAALLVGFAAVSILNYAPAIDLLSRYGKMFT